MIFGLPPIIVDDARILILGTLPGEESLRLGQYYANKRNHFWRILGEVYGEKTGGLYVQRLDFLRRHELALWDVLQSAERSGSSDARIKKEVPNALPKLLTTHSSLRVLVFNGKKAWAFFRKHVEKPLNLVPDTLRREVLPSTSPAVGQHVLPLEEKVARWRILKTL